MRPLPLPGSPSSSRLTLSNAHCSTCAHSADVLAPTIASCFVEIAAPSNLRTSSSNTETVRPVRNKGAIHQLVITFDAGQTLLDLDFDFLARRLRERDVAVEPGKLAAASPAAWRDYDAIVDGGASHRDAWLALVTSLLQGAGV